MSKTKLKHSSTVKSTVFQIIKTLGIIFIVVFVFFVSLDQISMSAARPPKSLKTIQDFQDWKQGAIMGKGIYENSGVNYTVMLAPAGRHMASGPSAYLFDQNGLFVDWTADLGDLATVHKRFDLSGGRVKNIERKKP